jgi:hypothetical protein
LVGLWSLIIPIRERREPCCWCCIPGSQRQTRSRCCPDLFAVLLYCAQPQPPGLMPPPKKPRTAPSVEIPIPMGAAAPNVSFQRRHVLNVCVAQSFCVCVCMYVCSSGPFSAVTLDPGFVACAFAVRRPRTVQLAQLRQGRSAAGVVHRMQGGKPRPPGTRAPPVRHRVRQAGRGSRRVQDQEVLRLLPRVGESLGLSAVLVAGRRDGFRGCAWLQDALTHTILGPGDS